jgi:thiol-disulfide isomerase/thioredoxin
MKNVLLKYFCAYCLFFLTAISLFAQKHFNLTVKLPPGINVEKVEASLEDAKTANKIAVKSKAAHQLVLTGDYYSIYAAVRLVYSPDPPIRTFANTFFIQEKPALIRFYPSDSAQYPFKNYSLANAWDFKKEKKQMEDYGVEERQRASDYEAQYGDRIFSSNDTAIRNQYFKVLMPALGRKKLEYIVNHPQSYYSFYIFRTDVARPNIASWDSLLLVFNSFPDEFKYSDEGNYVNAFLHGRLAKRKGDAIDFTARDINKKTITLSQFKSKKYVLLHFWATWCTPCMKELPGVKKISDQYKSKDLQIISIALQSAKYSDYPATIKKYQMDWIQIYNDRDLINRYGNQPAPRICLIDKAGKLIYDSIEFEGNDVQLSELHRILENTIK